MLLGSSYTFEMKLIHFEYNTIVNRTHKYSCPFVPLNVHSSVCGSFMIIEGIKQFEMIEHKYNVIVSDSLLISL